MVRHIPAANVLPYRFRIDQYAIEVEDHGIHHVHIMPDMTPKEPQRTVSYSTLAESQTESLGHSE